jgi:hypothetical protein
MIQLILTIVMFVLTWGIVAVVGWFVWTNTSSIDENKTSIDATSAKLNDSAFAESVNQILTDNKTTSKASLKTKIDAEAAKVKVEADKTTGHDGVAALEAYSSVLALHAVAVSQFEEFAAFTGVRTSAKTNYDKVQDALGVSPTLQAEQITALDEILAGGECAVRTTKSGCMARADCGWDVTTSVCATKTVADTSGNSTVDVDAGSAGVANVVCSTYTAAGENTCASYSNCNWDASAVCAPNACTYAPSSNVTEFILASDSTSGKNACNAVTGVMESCAWAPAGTEKEYGTCSSTTAGTCGNIPDGLGIHISKEGCFASGVVGTETTTDSGIWTDNNCKWTKVTDAVGRCA